MSANLYRREGDMSEGREAVRKGESEWGREVGIVGVGRGLLGKHGEGHNSGFLNLIFPPILCS